MKFKISKKLSAEPVFTILTVIYTTKKVNSNSTDIVFSKNSMSLLKFAIALYFMKINYPFKQFKSETITVSLTIKAK